MKRRLAKYCQMRRARVLLALWLLLVLFPQNTCVADIFGEGCCDPGANCCKSGVAALPFVGLSKCDADEPGGCCTGSSSCDLAESGGHDTTPPSDEHPMCLVIDVGTYTENRNVREISVPLVIIPTPTPFLTANTIAPAVPRFSKEIPGSSLHPPTTRILRI